MGTHTGSTLHWVVHVEDSYMGTHTGPTSYWVEQVEDYGDTY